MSGCTHHQLLSNTLEHVMYVKGGTSCEERYIIELFVDKIAFPSSSLMSPFALALAVY